MFRCGTTDMVPVHYYGHVEKPGKHNTSHIDLLKKVEPIKLKNFAIAQKKQGEGGHHEKGTGFWSGTIFCMFYARRWITSG
jgi:hypothetical protein